VLIAAPFSAWLALAARIGLATAIAPLLKTLSRGQSVAAVTSAFSLVGFLVLLPFVVFAAIREPAYFSGLTHYIDNAAGSGLIFCLSILMYNRALRMGDVNLLVPLVSLSLVIVYCFDLLLGNVHAALMPFVGIVIVVVGVTLLNITPGANLAYTLNPANVLRQPGAGGALVFAVGVSACRVIDHNAMHGSHAAPPLLYAALGNLLVVLYSLVILHFRGNAHRHRSLWLQRKGLATLTGVIGVANYLCMLYAYGYFAPSFMETITQLSTILSVFVGTLVFGEPLRLRWAAALLVAGGAALVVATSGKYGPPGEGLIDGHELSLRSRPISSWSAEQKMEVEVQGITLIADVCVLADHQVLMLRYTNTNSHDGQSGWFLPDDLLNDLEHPDKAAARILQEQTSIHDASPVLHHIESFRGMDGSWHLAFHYKLELEDVAEGNNNGGIAEARWFNIAELPPREEVAHHGWGLGTIRKIASKSS
jgi:uncharacterized membrane protein/ADP-ribose pyrophosphatase YjhB (NUDIX family)